MDDEGNSADEEPTVYKKEARNELKYEDISDSEDIEKHSEEKSAHLNTMKMQSYVKMRFY